jgi:hypothetical protein
MRLEAHQRRRFWQDTLVTPEATCVVYYEFGMLVPTVYVRGGGRRHPASVPASLFSGPDAQSEREWEMGLISQALGAAASQAKGAKAADAALEKTCPVLHAFMTEVEEDGKPRSPSSLVIFTEEGSWKGCLSEKDAGLQLWRTADSLQKLLAALEKALAGGNADWRRKFVPGGRGGPGKGKK